MGKVRAVCISEKRGTQKKNIESAVFVEDWGIQGDAHAGKWHRQVSLLSQETIEAFKARGAEITDGAFGENLVVSGYDFTKFPVGTRFACKDVVLELTQIGKECHHGCEIFQKMGECIMPTNGVFARVLHGGTIQTGDEFHVQYRVAVITLSDTASKGEREDVSGQIIADIVTKAGYEVVFRKIIPDDGEELTKLLCELADTDKADLILTTGGTGFSQRDNTPEATMQAIERETPGISEAMRYYSLQITPRAMLSRGVSGIRKEALIVNLPGSPKAVRECLEYAIGALTHGMDILKGNTGNCAGK
jgi:molybdopterin adenylyltransferase